MPTDDSVLRMVRGHRAAAERQRELMRAVGPNPALAVAECIAATEALARQGVWPGPRDPVSERGVSEVRRRWVLISRNGHQARA